MEKEKILEILHRVRICLKNNNWNIAYEYITLEINNLKDTKKNNYKNIMCKYCNDVICSNKQIID